MVDEPPRGGPSAPSTNWWKVLSAPTDTLDIVQQTPVDPTQTEDAPPPTRETADVIKLETANDMVANRTLREKYADKAHSLAFWCLMCWGLMISVSGFINGVRGKDLWSDQVIIAVTTGVTVSVLAAFLGVIRGLFPNGQLKESSKQEKKEGS